MTTFDRTTQLAWDPADPMLVTVDLDPAWSSLLGIHGGYLSALAVRAVEPRLDGRRVRTLTTSFLRPATPGPARVEVTTIRAGRSLATFDVTVRQEERAVIAARLTAVAVIGGTEWDHSPPLGVAPFAECLSVPPPWPVPHLDHGIAILDPAHQPLSGSEHAILRAHFRPAEARPIDEAWLAMALDWFPPAPWTRVAPPTGGVSVDYTVHIHRTLDEPLPDDSWLTVAFRAEVSNRGLTLEHGSLSAPDGRLLAESFHTRWTG